MFLLVAIALLVLLPWPWSGIAFVVCLVAFGGEVVVWNRSVRGRRPAVGAETVVGASARVVAVCRPEGQVQARGEIWRARCAQGADPGDEVVVVAQEGLVLVVERPASG